MQTQNSCEPVIEAEAVVHRVDPVRRELSARVDGAIVTIYVPPDCDVVLRGERIKLRMVQPLDRVRVTCTELAEPMVARAIEVQFDRPDTSLSQ